MRTNGFALYRGSGAPAMALEAASRVKRCSRQVLVSAGEEFVRTDEASLSGEQEVALAYSLEGGGFPLVHGFMEEATREGEFSVLRKDPSGFDWARDCLGTRGLWKIGEGRHMSLASDHRLVGHPLLDANLARVTSFGQAASELALLMEKAVEKRVRGHKKVAVSFSGGLDSSLLALLASRHSQVVLCSAFAQGARDERQTKRAAGLLGMKLETTLLDGREVARRSKEAALPPGEVTLMDRALWCIYSATSELAESSGAQLIMLGQLADELFGGYLKYALAANAQGAMVAEKMMLSDVLACGERGFLRDEAACSASCEVRFPFADREVASFAAGIPLDYKIRDGERKAILRAAAMELGLPEELARAPKKAAQFSSGAARLLASL
jgi:hypothetical protein